jgi:hypothetical protein
MKRHRTRPDHFAQSDEPLGPLERLAVLFAQDDESSNAERIQQMRRAYFADVDALQKSGTLKFPR